MITSSFTNAIIFFTSYINFFFKKCARKSKEGGCHSRWSMGNGYQFTESEVTEGMNGEGEVGVCVGREGIRLKPDD